MSNVMCKFFMRDNGEKAYQEDTILLQRFLWFAMTDFFSLSANEFSELIELSNHSCERSQAYD